MQYTSYSIVLLEGSAQYKQTKEGTVFACISVYASFAALDHLLDVN